MHIVLVKQLQRKKCHRSAVLLGDGSYVHPRRIEGPPGMERARTHREARPLGVGDWPGRRCVDDCPALRSRLYFEGEFILCPDASRACGDRKVRVGVSLSPARTRRKIAARRSHGLCAPVHTGVVAPLESIHCECKPARRVAVGSSG